MIVGVGALFRSLLRGYYRLGRLGGLLLLFDILLVSSACAVEIRKGGEAVDTWIPLNEISGKGDLLNDVMTTMLSN